MDIGRLDATLLVDPIEDPIAAVVPFAREPRETVPPGQGGGTNAPDYAAPIEGWRLWLVVEQKEGLRLASLLYDVEWPAERPLDAACLDGRRSAGWRTAAREAHAAPARSCGCGIYAVADRKRLLPYLDTPYPGDAAVAKVIGTVMLWGAVVAAEHGWRGAHAYPSRLFVPRRPGRDDLAEAVADDLRMYAPTELFDPAEHPGTTRVAECEVVR